MAWYAWLNWPGGLQPASITSALPRSAIGPMLAAAVFLITPEELAQADKYEVNDYRRVLAPLASGGSAWAYVAQEGSTGAA